MDLVLYQDLTVADWVLQIYGVELLFCLIVYRSLHQAHTSLMNKLKQQTAQQYKSIVKNVLYDILQTLSDCLSLFL